MDLRALRALLRLMIDFVCVGDDDEATGEPEAARRFDLVDVAVDCDSERRLRRLGVIGRLAFEDIFSIGALLAWTVA